jgi:hypothetical protein
VVREGTAVGVGDGERAGVGVAGDVELALVELPMVGPAQGDEVDGMLLI